jgi:hypothetical protein
MTPCIPLLDDPLDDALEELLDDAVPLDAEELEQRSPSGHPPSGDTAPSAPSVRSSKPQTEAHPLAATTSDKSRRGRRTLGSTRSPGLTVRR